MGDSSSPEGLGSGEKASLSTDKTSGHVSDSAGALEGVTQKEGPRSLCHMQAPSAVAAQKMCCLCSLATYKPLLVVGRKGSGRGPLLLLLILPSKMQAHTAAKDHSMACRFHRIT